MNSRGGKKKTEINIFQFDFSIWFGSIWELKFFQYDSFQFAYLKTEIFSVTELCSPLMSRFNSYSNPFNSYSNPFNSYSNPFASTSPPTLVHLSPLGSTLIPIHSLPYFLSLLVYRATLQFGRSSLIEF